MVSAGEVSGDMHAAAVLKEVKNKIKQTEIFGMGSTALLDLGAEILIDPTAISTIGYLEAFKNIGQHFKNLKQMRQLLKKRQPDLVFLVDYSAFNMRLAKSCSQLGIPAVNYFPPSAWVYNRRRADKMAAYGTNIAAVFPMERDVYQAAGADVTFVGHPLLDLVKVQASSSELRAELKLSKVRKVIALFPGSRHSEVESLLPEMIKAAARLHKDYQTEFVLAAAAGITDQFLAKFLDKIDFDLPVLRGSNYKIMKAADLLLIASGTTSLEAAILNTPHLLGYHSAFTTYLLAKYIFKVRFVGLPNIIMQKEIIPELLQNDFTAAKIYRQVADWLENPVKLQQLKSELAVVRKKLGGGGAVKKTAELLIDKGGLRNG